MEIKRKEAPLIFLYVFLSTTLAIMLIYFISLLIFHCVFWPKILAKIKADKPKETAKQQQLLRELTVGRDRQMEDKTQSERTETPTQVIERTQSVDDIFNAAQTVVSENASLVGDKTSGSVRTCASTVTAAPAASPQLGVLTAKESRPGKGRRWFEDDMMTTGMEILQPPNRESQSKDHKRRNKERKRSDEMRTGREDGMHLRTGRERKEGGKTTRKLRFADDLRTCMEKAPLLSQSYEDPRKSEDAAAQRRSEELRRRKKTGTPGAKEQQPRSVYAYEADPKQEKPQQEKKPGGKVGTTTAVSKSTDNSREKGHEKLMELCKTQED